MNYKYEVRDSAGHVTAGVIQAESAAEAAARLRGQGGFLLNVAPMAAAGGDILQKLKGLNFQLGPGLKDVQSFTNQLAVMIKAGISIRNAISSIAEQVPNLKFQRIIEQIKSDVESGQPFSDALARHPKVFSPLYVNMVKASELSGNFGQMLERIAAYLAQQVETRSMVRGAMIYPAIIGTMAVITTIFLLTFVLPKFGALFAGREDILPLPTKMINALSAFMIHYWYAIIGGVVLLVMTCYYAIQTPGGRVAWDRVKLKVPLFKRMFRALYITRGLHTMGELVNAGVPMLETLAITARVSGNVLYRRMWETVHNSVKQGSKIADPLGRQSMLPKSVVQMISAGEESGKLGEVMRDIAEYYAKELKATIKAVTAMIEPLMIVLMGAVVGFIAMSIILPIFKMSSLVK
ncbi:MAG: type II secretion system F family protein [Phycisphaerae bacterium]